LAHPADEYPGLKKENGHGKNPTSTM